MFKIDVSSQVEKHVTYFLQRAISFRYSSATIQNNISLGQYIPKHHRVPNNHAITQGHPFKISKFIDKSSKIRKAVLTISNCHDICHFKAATSPNLTINPSHPTLQTPSLVTRHHQPISLHADWPSKLHNSLYIHHDHFIFQNLHILISHASHQ